MTSDPAAVQVLTCPLQLDVTSCWETASRVGGSSANRQPWLLAGHQSLSATCLQEGFGPCFFCGEYFGKERKRNKAKDDKDEESQDKANAHKDRLLNFDRCYETPESL